MSIKNNQNITNLQNGINFINQQIAQFSSLIFTMQQQLKEFEENKKRMEMEIDENIKGRK
jgi:uncharacterized protein (DUF3084 family)